MIEIAAPEGAALFIQPAPVPRAASLAVSQLDRVSVNGQDSPIVLTDHFPMAHAQPPRRWPVILPGSSQLQPGNQVYETTLAADLFAIIPTGRAE